MRSRPQPRWLVKVYAALFGVILVCAAGVIYLLVLKTVLGSFDGRSGGWLAGAPPRTAVLVSKYTADYGASIGSEFLAGGERFWVDHLRSEEGAADVELIDDDDLERWGRSGNRKYDNLVLPGVYCLSSAERDAITRFLEAGGGVVATGPTGCRDETGAWATFDFLRTLTGGAIVDPLSDSTAVLPWYISLRGETPVTANLPAGLKIRIRDGRFALAVTGADGESAAFYADGTGAPVDILPDAAADIFPAVVRRRAGKGRIVWIGFTMANVVFDKEIVGAPHRMAVNAVRWTSGRTVGAIATWPDAERCAVVFSQDTESYFENAAATRSVFEKIGVPITYFCVSDSAVKNAPLTASLAGTGEVGSHSDNHAPFAGESYDTQYERLARSRDDLEEITGSPCVGMRPPEEKYDGNTVAALAAAGYRYLVGGVRLPSAVPRILTVPGTHVAAGGGARRIVAIPRTGYDDNYIIEQLALHEPKEILDAYRRSFQTQYMRGGVYFVSFHTHLLAREGVAEVMPKLVNHVRSKKTWITSAAGVAEWWVERDALRMSADVTSPGRLTVHVSNEYDRTVPRAVTFLDLPRRPSSIRISSDIVGTPQPDYDLSDDGYRLNLRLEKLKPRENRSFRIDLS